MNKKKNLLVSVLFVAVSAVLYLYLEHSGLWGRYRWTGLAFGAVWAVVYVLLRKDDDHTHDLAFAMFFCLIGLSMLLDFLTMRGDSGQGFLAVMFLGFAAQGLYAHYKSRRLTMQNKTSAP